MATDIARDREAVINAAKKAGLSGRQISRALGVKVKNPKVKSASRRQIQRIAVVFCSIVDVPLADLIGSRRYNPLPDARAAAMQCVWGILGAKTTLKAIGDYFGGRDHSTVHHALSRAVHPKFKKAIREVDDKLFAIVNER